MQKKETHFRFAHCMFSFLISKPSSDGFTFCSTKQTLTGGDCQLSKGQPLSFQEWQREGHGKDSCDIDGKAAWSYVAEQNELYATHTHCGHMYTPWPCMAMK